MIGVAPIPDSLGGLSNLTLLWLAYNDLDGCIPAAVHRLTLVELPPWWWPPDLEQKTLNPQWRGDVTVDLPVCEADPE